MPFGNRMNWGASTCACVGAARTKLQVSACGVTGSLAVVIYSGGVPVASGTTDSNHEIDISALPPGRYTITSPAAGAPRWASPASFLVPSPPPAVVSAGFVAGVGYVCFPDSSCGFPLSNVIDYASTYGEGGPISPLGPNGTAGPVGAVGYAGNAAIFYGTDHGWQFYPDNGLDYVAQDGEGGGSATYAATSTSCSPYQATFTIPSTAAGVPDTIVTVTEGTPVT